ncbi:alpha/beta fold hydrolase [Micromonospora sonneratiae]|uniref:Alpha/beta fold hydrolase n=1 Tax=Micromonospora sonneratiae TaxID=1184706 RepID=A0ABW3YDW1_9ACTN
MRHHPSANHPGPAVDVPPPLGQLYGVGGRRLMLHRSGSGGPAVVFLPGAGMVGLDYLNIHDRVAEFTTSVLYDRAGTGWSEPADLPRSAAEVTDELRELLVTAGVPAPYLLVGHSLGGAYARHYAQRFSDEVAGLLLLDPIHEDFVAHLPRQLPETRRPAGEQPPAEPTEDFVQLYRGLLGQRLAGWPEEVRQPLVERHLASWRTPAQETANIDDEIHAELRQAGANPDLPLIVLTVTGGDRYHTNPDRRRVEPGWNVIKLVVHAALAGSVPRGQHRVLDDAGHSGLHVDRPDAVLQAIQDLLAQTAD